MDQNYEANLTLSNNIANALFAYATLDLGDMSDTEKEAQMETCQDIADFIVFSLGINSEVLDDGESFTANGKFGNYVDLLQNFLEQ